MTHLVLINNHSLQKKYKQTKQKQKKTNKQTNKQTNKHASRLILNLSSETYYAIKFQERNIIKKGNTIKIF